MGTEADPAAGSRSMAGSGGETRTVLITGCASGLGRHLTGALLARGFRVAATDLDFEALERAGRDDAWPREQLLLQPLDVTRPEAWEAAMAAFRERFGRLDVVINNAGHLQPGWVHEIEPAAVDRHLDVNAKGVIYGTAAAARRMLEQGGGHIINIASLAGVAPIPGIALYSASKFAVRGFSLAAAQELASRGVAVTAVCPDAIRTPMLTLQKDYPEAALSFSSSRFLTVEEVGRLILGRVLERRPREVLIPRSRAWTAKLAAALPAWTDPLARFLQRVGERRRRTFEA